MKHLTDPEFLKSKWVHLETTEKVYDKNHYEKLCFNLIPLFLKSTPSKKL